MWIPPQINKDFGSFDAFKTKFAEAGNTAFGSGWAWLSWDGSKLVPHPHSPIHLHQLHPSAPPPTPLPSSAGGWDHPHHHHHLGPVAYFS